MEEQFSSQQEKEIDQQLRGFREGKR